jgi:hypothetical protein
MEIMDMFGYRRHALKQYFWCKNALKAVKISQIQDRIRTEPDFVCMSGHVENRVKIRY